MTPLLTPAQLAAEFNVGTRTVARWDRDGCPCEWAGSRRRYDLQTVKDWNRERACRSEKTTMEDGMRKFALVASAYTDVYRRVQVRAMPSGLKPT